ncbi:MAG: HAD family phosphatase [Nitrospira sp.]|nr:MAG: HAD family phosphatase [Nitrospira sp.]
MTARSSVGRAVVFSCRYALVIMPRPHDRQPDIQRTTHRDARITTMSELRAIIFDFDGVIADTEPLHFAALRQVLAGIEISLTEAEYYTDYLGFDDRGCFLAALQAHQRQASPTLLGELMEHKAHAYLAAVKQHLAIFPGVRELVHEAAARYPLAIASGALRNEIELILEEAGLRRAFLHITSAEDVTRGKPAPDPFLHAMAGLNSQPNQPALSPNDCLVIEDSLPGIRAARAAGMKVLAVANTHTVQDLGEADAITHSLADTRLQDLQARLWGAAQGRP